MIEPIYTRGGDEGETSLVGGTRIGKDAPRVEAYGAIDEASSHIGLAGAATTDPLLREALDFVQQRLFNCASRLATPDDAVSDRTPGVSPADVAAIERMIDRMTKEAGGFSGFVLPGGCEPAARLHVARAVARRAERVLVALSRTDAVDAQVMAFVNRLSDLLFIAARYANSRGDTPVVRWDPDAGSPDI